MANSYWLSAYTVYNNKFMQHETTEVFNKKEIE